MSRLAHMQGSLPTFPSALLNEARTSLQRAEARWSTATQMTLRDMLDVAAYLGSLAR